MLEIMQCFSFLEEPRRSKEFEQVYVALYSRAGPYLVGFLSAYVTIKLQERKFQFSLVSASRHLHVFFFLFALRDG